MIPYGCSNENCTLWTRVHQPYTAEPRKPIIDNSTGVEVDMMKAIRIIVTDNRGRGIAGKRVYLVSYPNVLRDGAFFDGDDTLAV